MEFLGYPRPGGSVGIRNYVLVIPGGLVASKICDFVPGAKTIVTTQGGVGMTSRDRETVAGTLVGLGLNPNVAGVIVQGGSPQQGYPELRNERLFEEISRAGKPVKLIDTDREGGTLEAIQKGIQVAREMVFEASRVRREPASFGKLTVGVKCGGSDPTSGMVGNPVVGCLCDRLVEAGGTALFGETTEVIGAEHILSRRAVNAEVARQILERVRLTEERALATGEDLRTVNPAPENIAGGISTLEEKSLGAIFKAGHQPIQGVLKYGERPRGPGLYFVDCWMYVYSIYAGFAAAGAQLTLLQYGGGGNPGRTIFDPPSPGLVAPLLWASANPLTQAQDSGNLDFYSGTVIQGKERLEDAGERLVRQVLEIASGTLTRGETINYSNPTHIYTSDPVF
jgi:altronate dehydratase large subunit